MSHRFTRLFVLITSVFIIRIAFASNLRIEKIQNTLAEIEHLDGRIGLNHIREWGGEKETDINKMFYSPMDITSDTNENIYVLEKTKILVFNRERNFIKKIGGPGQGPGEFLGATYIMIDSDNTLIVYDSDNRRIQLLNSDRNILENIPLETWNASPITLNKRKEFVMYNTSPIKETTSLWQIFNYKGKLLKQLGVREGADSTLENSRKYAFNILSDNECRIFGAAVFQPIIKVYSYLGELEKEISYELPFRVPEIKAYKRLGREYIDCEMVCRGIAVDRKNNIFVLTSRRMRNTEEEKIGMSYTGYEKLDIFTPHVNNLNTDLFQILIFDASGKIISSNRLNIYANKIRIFNDHLFIIDSYVNMNIHEYLISN